MLCPALLVWLGSILLLLKIIETLEEGLARFLIKDIAHLDEVPGIVPFFVAGQHVQCVDLHDLDF